MHTAPFQLHMVPDKLFPLAAPAVTAAAIHKLPFTSCHSQVAACNCSCHSTHCPLDSTCTSVHM